MKKIFAFIFCTLFIIPFASNANESNLELILETDKSNPFSSDGIYFFGDKKIEIYSENEKKFIKVNENIYGPFDKENSRIKAYADEDNMYLQYLKDGKYYIRINENILGPYDYVDNLKYNNGDWAFSYKNNDGIFVKHKDKIYGPYWAVMQMDLTNNLIFTYREIHDNQNRPDGKNLDAYAYVNGTIYGPYLSVWNREKPGPDWYLYINNEPEYKVISNGKEFGPYKWRGYSSGGYAEDLGDYFSYAKSKEEKYYIENGQEFGPFDYINSAKRSSEHFAFLYGKDNKKYIRIDNDIYENILSYDLSGNNFCFVFEESNQKFVKINDTKYGPFKNLTCAVSEESYGYRYTENNKMYVVLNGEKFGPYEDIYMKSFDVGKNIWSAVGETGGIFSHGKGCVLVNGEKFGPFDFHHVAHKIIDDKWMLYNLGGTTKFYRSKGDVKSMNKQAIKPIKSDEFVNLFNIRNTILIIFILIFIFSIYKFKLHNKKMI